MQTYELMVRGRSISASPSNRTLVRTSIGVDQIHVLFDSAEWLEFPIEVTFGQGDDKVTQPVVMAAIQGSQDWAAETTATVPWEVVDGNGSIAVTFQGTDSQGRHLITAKGAPLRVTEAGDVVAGGEPSDAPSVSEWQQAYADAMAAVNQAASLVANLQQSLESMVSEAEGAISSAVEEAEQSIGSIQPATAESLGVVRIGEGIDVDQNGVISTSGGSGMTDAQRTDLARLKSLSAAMADATYSGSSVTGSPKVKPSALPVASVTTPGAVIPDGTTIRVDQYGMIHSYSETIEPATTEFVGGVKPDGTTITIDQDGTIHGTEQTQIATTSLAGKVKPDGTTITVEEDGTIHGVEQIATVAAVGSVKPDGTTITVDADGTIHGVEQTPVATVEVAGKVKPDGTTITVQQDGTISSATLPDWDENDQSDPAYIANRPFYEAPVHKVLLDGYHVDRQSFQYGNEPSYVEYGSIPLEEAMEAGKTYRVTISDSHRVYSGTGEFASDDTPLPAIDGTIKKRFVIECEDMLRTSVTLRLYGSYMPSQDTVSFGDIDITLELFETDLVQLPSKFVPVASASSVGGIKPDGTTITVGADGTASAVSGYTLPTATSSRLGGVKVDGTSVTADQDGTIHAASAYTLPDATTTQKGGVIVGDGIKVSGGTISVPTPDWNADQGEDGHIANRPFYDTKQWVQVASGRYDNTSGMKVGGYYWDSYSRMSYTDGGFDPTLPARLTFDGGTYDMAFSGSGGSWVSYSEDLVYQIQASQSGNRWYFALRCSTPNVLNVTYAIHSYAPAVTKLPQRFVDYSPCSPAISDSPYAYSVNLFDYVLLLSGSNYVRVSLHTVLAYALREYSTDLDTNSQTVAGAIDELHGDLASLATPEYVNEQTSSLASRIASLARRVEAIEKELGISTMSYEDGTLYVSGTYEDGTLVTGSSYQDGTLL